MLLLTSCSSDDGAETDDGAAEAVTSPAPAPAPSPSPTQPPPTPVAGSIDARMQDASRPTILGLADDGEGDADAATTAAAAVATSLDAFLNTAQNGAGDLSTLQADWLQDADPEAAAALVAIATVDNPVSAAAYDLTVHVEEAPTLVVGKVTVTLADGTVTVAEVVMDVTGEQPVLQAVAVGGGA